ncbi:Solute carrier family 13 member 2 [Armadillidium vulgare]|nr:Solute carrier family 13 member 2 [Armadillidium vulgare]
MVLYWVTEAIPMAVTALIPIFAFPLLGVMSSSTVCHTYLNETTILLLGGLIFAVVVEHSNLHKRIALFVTLHVGQSPRKLLFGFMLTTTFLSMWISNIASTAMMVPIVDAVLKELYKEAFTVNVKEVKEEEEEEEKTGDCVDFKTLKTMYFLGVAYAANIGGIGTLTGAAPNLVLKDVLDTSRSKLPETTEEKRNKVKELIKTQYNNLGKISFHEMVVVVIFFIVVLLWLLREPGFMPGWADLVMMYFPHITVGDGVPAILATVFFFIIPSHPNFWPSLKYKDGPSEGCVIWRVVHEKVPWDIIFLLGGGFAMAKGCNDSGLSVSFGEKLRFIDSLPPSVGVFFDSVATEVISNTAIASILVPILKELMKAGWVMNVVLWLHHYHNDQHIRNGDI